MKKIFLILALTSMMSMVAYADENKDKSKDSDSKTATESQEAGATATEGQSVVGSSEGVVATSTENTSGGLGSSFMAAFGMGGVSNGGSSVAVGTAVGSSTSNSTVKPGFTPYSYSVNALRGYVSTARAFSELPSEANRIDFLYLA